MRKLSIVLVLFLAGCLEEELPFNPTVEHIYNNQFLVWKKTSINVDNDSGISERVESRDITLQYIFTSGKAEKSTDGGESFREYPNSYIGLDSIAILDANNVLLESFYVRDIFRMKNTSIRENQPANPRDEVFPELAGFYLFLELEKKQKLQIEGKTVTETYLMYSEGYPEE